MRKASIAKKVVSARKAASIFVSVALVAALCVPIGVAYAAGDSDAGEAEGAAALANDLSEKYIDGIILSFDDIPLEQAKAIVTDRLGWKIKRVMDMHGDTWGTQYGEDGFVWREIVAYYPEDLGFESCRDRALSIEHIIGAEENGSRYDIIPSPARLAGTDALDTMEAIVERGWIYGSCDSVVVVSQDSATDGMVATGLASLLDCPVLTTNSRGLSSQAWYRIVRLGTISKVYLVGGQSVLSDFVEDSALSIPGVKSIERVYGRSAADTAVAVLEKGEQLGGWGDTAVVATSGDFRDAMSAAPFAYARHAPVLLSDEGGLGGRAARLAAGFDNVVIAGGPNAVPPVVESQVGDASVTRVYGQSAYDTSRAIADWCLERGMSLEHAGVATGMSHMDAVAGAALCGRGDSPLLLVSDPSASEAISYFSEHDERCSNGYIFGGPSVISKEAESALWAIRKR